MDTSTILSIVSIVVSLVFAVLGVVFSIQTARNLKAIESKLELMSLMKDLIDRIAPAASSRDDPERERRLAELRRALQAPTPTNTNLPRVATDEGKHKFDH
jgi:hypothetical protein